MRFENMTPIYIGIGICVILTIVLTVLFGMIGTFIAMIMVGSGIAGFYMEDRRMEQEERARQSEEENRKLREERWRNNR